MNDPRIQQTIVHDPKNPKNHLLVSTVHTDRDGPETLVFPVIIDWSEIDGQRYDTEAEAIAGHAAIVRKLERG